MSGQHRFVDKTCLSGPRALGAWHFCHRANEAEVRVGSFQLLQRVQKWRIFGPAVGIKEIQLVWRSVMIGLSHNAEKRCDSDSTREEHGRFSRILMEGERARCGVHFYRDTERQLLQ